MIGFKIFSHAPFIHYITKRSRDNRSCFVFQRSHPCVFRKTINANQYKSIIVVIRTQTENRLNRIRIGRQYPQQTLRFAGSFYEQVCAENTFPEHVPIDEHLFVSILSYLIFSSSFRRTNVFPHH